MEIMVLKNKSRTMPSARHVGLFTRPGYKRHGGRSSAPCTNPKWCCGDLGRAGPAIAARHAVAAVYGGSAGQRLRSHEPPVRRAVVTGAAG